MVSVAAGYARNYLVPKGLAVLATEGHRKLVAEHMKLAAKREDLRKAGAEELAAKLGELSCTITVQAGETATPDGTWNSTSVPTSGDTAGVTGRSDILAAIFRERESQAAKLLGIDRVSLWRKLKKLGIDSE